MKKQLIYVEINNSAKIAECTKLINEGKMLYFGFATGKYIYYYI